MSKSLNFVGLFNKTGINKINVIKPPQLPSLAPKVIRCIHCNSSRNNTMLSYTVNGDVKAWASAGTCGLKKAARGTSDAGYQATLSLLSKIKLDASIHLIFKGFGPGRDSCFRALKAGEVAIFKISDVTPVRHGGCRPKKKRRL